VCKSIKQKKIFFSNLKILYFKRTPHPLIWAKMKGFPFWPAKALRIVNGLIDVRFFGAHDRLWTQTSKCFWLSKNLPSGHRLHLNNLQPSLSELNLHIERLIKKFGEFNYAPNKATIDADKPFIFIPSLKGIFYVHFFFKLIKFPLQINFVYHILLIHLKTHVKCTNNGLIHVIQ
jgi:hypothetical protein